MIETLASVTAHLWLAVVGSATNRATPSSFIVMTNAKLCLTIRSGSYLAMNVSAAGLITCSSEAPGQATTSFMAGQWSFPERWGG